MAEDTPLVKTLNTIRGYEKKAADFLSAHDTPIMGHSVRGGSETNMNWTPAPNAQQAAEIKRNAATSNEHAVKQRQAKTSAKYGLGKSTSKGQ